MPSPLSLVSRDRLAKARVLVVGDAMLDRYWHGAVDRISPEAPVPVVRITREEERLGGAANVACNVVSLGARATLLTVVGDDEAGHKVESLLAQSGVVPRIGRDVGLRTTVKLRVIGRQQQLLRLDFENQPNTELLASQTAAFAELVAEHDAVLFSDYGKGGLAHVAEMIDRALAHGKPVLIDPKGSDYSRYRNASIITPNRAEMQQVIGPWRNEAELQQKAEGLRQQLNLDAVLVTLGEQGMALFRRDLDSLWVGAQAREVFDVTGAGDTVIATMGALMAAGLAAGEAMPLANRAGALVVGKFGTATVSYEELFE
jgi:rfaE bifunctional protein kinase chain/domain